MSYWIKSTTNGVGISGVQWSLGNVTHETISKNANLMIIPMPLADSSSTDVFDYMGVTREITVEGTYNANTTGSVTSWTGSMMGLIAGNQAISWYNSDIIAGSIPVKISYFNAEQNGGETISVRWNLKMTESTTTS